jgi:hypothetical protein
MIECDGRSADDVPDEANLASPSPTKKLIDSLQSQYADWSERHPWSHCPFETSKTDKWSSAINHSISKTGDT